MQTTESSSSSPASKHVLFVDDEPVSCHVAERILRTGIPNIRVTCAANGAEALEILDREPVDLLITDLAMPVLDGIELLLAVAHRRLLIPLLVVSGHKSPLNETLAFSSGAVEYFEKPLRPDPFLHCASRLLFEKPHRGQLEVISLVGILRMIEMERKTCSLRVTSAISQGALMFADGDLVDARQGVLHGLPAAMAILAWPDVTITLDTDAPTRAPTIRVRVRELLRLFSGRALTPPPPPTPAPPRRQSAANDSGVLDPPPEYRPTAAVPPLERIELATRPRQAAAIDPSDGPRASSRPPPSLQARIATVAQPTKPPSVPPPPRVAAPVRTLLPSMIVRASAPKSSANPPQTPPTQEPAPAADAGPASDPAPVSPTPPSSPSEATQDPTRPDPALVRVLEGEGYHDLMDRARDLLRAAEFAAAEQLLLRALVHRPGDRVALQNLRVLARKRGDTAALESTPETLK